LLANSMSPKMRHLSCVRARTRSPLSVRLMASVLPLLLLKAAPSAERHLPSSLTVAWANSDELAPASSAAAIEQDKRWDWRIVRGSSEWVMGAATITRPVSGDVTRRLRQRHAAQLLHDALDRLHHPCRLVA